MIGQHPPSTPPTATLSVSTFLTNPSESPSELLYGHHLRSQQGRFSEYILIEDAVKDRPRGLRRMQTAGLMNDSRVGHEEFSVYADKARRND